MLRLRRDIPLFPGGRKKAFTLSSDDGVSQDIPLTALMRKYGIKGTFHLNSGLMGDNDWLHQPKVDTSHYKLCKNQISEVYEGFEVSCHTMTHPDLTRVPSAMTAYEIAENKKELEDLVHHPVPGMSYPFGTYNDEVAETARRCGIVYSRTVKHTGNFSLPEDFLKWHPTSHYCENDRMELASRFLAPVSDADYRNPLLFYVWGHAYQLETREDWDSMEEFLKLVSGHEDVWYASNLEICSYMKAVKDLIYSSTGDYISNPSCQDVWMMIDQQVYCIKSGETVTVGWKHSDDSVK